MYRFWNDIIAPCLEAANAKNIVEVGSKAGDNTRNLLKYCSQFDGHIFAIDTAPQQEFYDLLETDSDHRITFIQDLSLNTLDKLPPYDTILLDGDHNWYTVYHELKMIASHIKPFPLVILHDVDWPYARRDMFYDPANIPAKYLPNIEQKGIDPTSDDLCEHGYNDKVGFWHSIAHHTPQTGVLTAVEDFLKESPGKYSFIKIPMNHGLGFITSNHDPYPQKLIDFLDSLNTSENVRNLIRCLAIANNAQAAAAIWYEQKEFKAEYEKLKRLSIEYENSESFRIGSKIVKFYWKIKSIFGFGKQ